MNAKYHCDYCNISFKDDGTKRKTHLNGFAHNRAKNEYLLLHRDIRDIIQQESAKQPCVRFLNGMHCNFGASCRFTHYSPPELDNLRRIADDHERKRMARRVFKSESSGRDLLNSWLMKRNKIKTSKQLTHKKVLQKNSSESGNESLSETSQLESTQIDNENGNDDTNVFTWTRPRIMLDMNFLPPSLREFKEEDFTDSDFAQW
ncbi:zinc finger matrin-type protein 5-like [Ctenocephalides felis]|uniref:zinc finger matrin-type protein 5-like n=1 Tax=Ctenocephalides felis TaxID=7515 RepID=UPI000E6E3F21|nr:zinc finger matrin-type protein 5-like [Ctenocephalides felis]